MSKYQSLGALIDAPIEEVKTELEKPDYGISDLTNIKKGLELEYQRVETTKDEIIRGVNEEKIDSKKGSKSLDDLYIILQRIEDLCTIIEELKKQRKIPLN